MEVRLLSFTQNAERICAAAANGCYSESPSFEIINSLTGDGVERIIKKVTDSGHLSVIEHASFTFSVSGVSRALSHQLVRHRLASYSQQSMRYVNFEKLNYVTPPSVAGDPSKKEVFEMAMRIVEDTYKNLIKKGIKPEDARFILPEGSQTALTLTMNARELLHFFRLRCCTTAQWEIRALADEMLRQCKEVCPVIFRNAGPSCVSEGYCTEGEKSCGRAPLLKRAND
ncbi:FAD-dependent thymidylate synthase [Candidatus Micrarchaeota archaeon]|nr:FAD-dependent thymidylate synthase [Candidatus Micrarchaeota archaeon]